MSELHEEMFKNKGIIPVDTLSKFKLKCLEDIGKDLVEYGSWDMAVPVAALGLIVQEGQVSQCVLTLHGGTDPKRIDAKVVFGENYRGADQHIKIDSVDLQKLRFRGTMVSQWMSSQEFDYRVMRPSTSVPGAWREVEQAKVEEDGGASLWLRSVVQPWTGLKLKMTLGIMTAKDISKIPESMNPRFPFINILSTHVPVLPAPPSECSVCLPFVPYLISDEEDEVLPEWKTILRCCNGMLRETTAPHSKSNLDNLMETLKGDWRAPKGSKYIYPVLIEEEIAVEEVDDGEEDATEGGTEKFHC